MKVLYITNIPAPYTVDFLNYLGQFCDLTVTFERKYADDRSIDWVSTNFRNFKGVILEGIKVSKSSSLSLKIIKFLYKNDFDIIIVGGYGTPSGFLSICYLSIFPKKFILNLDGAKVKEDNLIMKLIKRIYLSRVSLFLCPGIVCKNYLRKLKIPDSKIEYYPFTSVFEIDIIQKRLEKEEIDQIKRHLKIKEPKIVLSVGQIIYRKGFDVLLKSLKYIDEIKHIGIYIIGGKPTYDFQKTITENNLQNVHFIDFLDKDNLKLYYNIADLFVLPTREDIWGLVINEAMAYGLPIITTNKCIAGLELIEEGVNGFLIPSNNHKELASRINYFFNHYELHNTIANNNLAKIKNYTLEKMAKKHLDIFNTFQ